MSEKIIYGKNPVRELLDAGVPVEQILVEKSGGRNKNRDIVQKAKKSSIILEYVSSKVLAEKTGKTNHQGVVAILPVFKYTSTEEIISLAAAESGDPLIVICDHIEDPHNLGAIIRNAEAFGADGLLIPSNRSAQVNATVVKTSSGAVFHLPVAQVTNLVQEMDKLKKAGYWIIGTDVTGDRIDKQQGLEGSLAVVIGGEGKGMRSLVQKNCDLIVTIPMKGKTGSLNASVASGIVLYEINRRKAGSDLS